MSNDWEELFNEGLKQLESEIEESIAAFDEWTKALWDNGQRSHLNYYREATVLYQQGQYARAIQKYTEAITCNEDYRAYFYRGACHCLLARKKQGLKDYDRTLAIKPDFADGYYYRGFLRKNLGDLVGAVEDFTRLIKLDPDRIDAYFNRGIAYSGIAQYDRAIKDFTKLINFAPTANKHYNRGVTYYQIAEYRQAIVDLAIAVELEPQFISAHLTLGNAYFTLGDREQATYHYQQASQIEGEVDPNDEHGYYAQGIAAFNQEDNPQSLMSLTKAAVVCQQNHNLSLHIEVINLINSIKELP